MNIHTIPKHAFKNNRFELLFDSGKEEDVDFQYTIHDEAENNQIINDDYDENEDNDELKQPNAI